MTSQFDHLQIAVSLLYLIFTLLMPFKFFFEATFSNSDTHGTQHASIVSQATMNSEPTSSANLSSIKEVDKFSGALVLANKSTMPFIPPPHGKVLFKIYNNSRHFPLSSNLAFIHAGASSGLMIETQASDLILSLPDTVW